MKIPKKKATFCIILHQNGIIGHKIGCECPEKSVLVFEGAGGIVESKNERQKNLGFRLRTGEHLLKKTVEHIMKERIKP